MNILASIDKNQLAKAWDSIIKFLMSALGWIGMMFIHLSTVPTLLAVNAGVIDKLPSVDIVLLIWTGLAIWMAKALLEKDQAMVAGIGVGFIVQAVLMALLVFK